MKTYINYRPPVPCFGNDPAADIELIRRLNNPPQDRSGIWATLAIIAGAIAIASIYF